ncbi:lipoprotein-anchoring transpeptidase ErfK/SrfK [Breoghania corrubedonensis]|uniref:Lipoprotein-anchoring transpeptidase ErfK/SrfK n=1 Tax=Breoghania corrubedonensis TaxID=665038 RepID=A0A2T5VAT8_9HYPH|nr:L,D-transpeptidase [Breoghania corrubedonensis]PTW60861.1 lipoprotein-anchoring transpeptidase ErfK/SrfK [Breoghania corrubedonensis]
MRKLLTIAAAVLVAGTAAATSATANTKVFDPATKTWMKIGPGAHSGKSPIDKKVVSYDGGQAPGTVIIDTGERRLYYVMSGGRAMKYGIGVGREGFQWAGTKHISRKAEWPGWTPPPQMVARERRKGRKLPSYMEGGPNNPLGARAMYLGSSLYRIHGSNEPWTIGQAVSSGCIRMANEDVIDLYDRVDVGAKVIVKR